MLTPPKTFVFDGQPSSKYGIFINGAKTFNGAELDFEKVSIPGRNGDLLLTSNRAKNKTHEYDAWIAYDLGIRAASVRDFLLSKNGYCRLEDDYNPDEYYEAFFAGPIDFDVTLLTAGTTTLIFDRKPQRFLKIGERPITIAANTTVQIFNPTPYESLPIITFSGAKSGSFVVNETTVTISDASGNNTTINSEIQQSYDGTTNRNGNVSLTDDTYPTLKAGTNTIKNNSSATLKLIPRWYRL